MVTVSIEREVVSKPFFTKAWLGRQSMAWSTHVVRAGFLGLDRDL